MTCQPQMIDGPKQNRDYSPTVISQWLDECSGTTKLLGARTNQAAGNDASRRRDGSTDRHSVRQR